MTYSIGMLSSSFWSRPSARRFPPKDTNWILNQRLSHFLSLGFSFVMKLAISFSTSSSLAQPSQRPSVRTISVIFFLVSVYVSNILAKDSVIFVLYMWLISSPAFCMEDLNVFGIPHPLISWRLCWLPIAYHRSRPSLSKGPIFIANVISTSVTTAQCSFIVKALSTTKTCSRSQ